MVPPVDKTDTEALASDVRELQRDMSDAKRDMGIMGSLMHRIDATIEKLHELSINVSKLLAVHEQRFVQNEEMRRAFMEASESKRLEMEKRIDSEVKRLELNDERALGELRGYRAESNTHMVGIENKLSRIERMFWIITGGGVVVGYILSSTNVLSKIFGT